MKITNKTKIYVLLLVVSFMLNPAAIVEGLAFEHNDNTETDAFDSYDWENGISDDNSFIKNGAAYAEDQNLGQFLSDNDNSYRKTWDPWLTKAAIHAIATTDDGNLMALAGGYLYDDEVHLYAWNEEEDQYDLVWEVGSEVFKSDVLTLAFADTDYNNLTEIIAGSEDGYFYVFEQRHIYDPYTNMENMYDLVYKSPRLGRVFSLLVDDTDKDFRQDIIVGTGDTIRHFEYDTHGNYPFGPDHWIEYREVFSYQMPDQITALGTADVDYDGLPEVAVGLRSGEIILMENDGETLYINGFPYPIIQDNAYVPIWSSGKNIRRSISDMSGGDIDDDGQKELLITVQGQGAYVLDNVNGVIGTYRIERPFTEWESNPIEIYPLDYFADSMVNSSSLFEGALLPAGSTQGNVYGFSNAITAPEPLNQTGYNFPEIYPYSAHSVMLKDGLYTTMNAANKLAWAIYDFGYDEEASGNGVTGVKDLILWVQSNVLATSNLQLSISMDGVNYATIENQYIAKVGSDQYQIEVDPALEALEADYYQYLRVNVTSGFLKIDVIETKHVNQPIFDALSSAVGELTLKDELFPTTVGYIATIDGAILGIDWNPDRELYEVIWDSWVEERYKLGTNIFDLEIVKKTSRFPAWVLSPSQSPTLDLSNVVSYTAENFYNYQNENNLEFIVSQANGFFAAYSTASPNGQPVYNDDLTQMLFNTPYGIFPSVNDYLLSQQAKGAVYFSASLVPVETVFANPLDWNDYSITQIIDPIHQGWWLFIGSWDSYVAMEGVGPQSAEPFINDVSIWNLNQAPNNEKTPMCDGIFATDMCAIFSPLANFTVGYKTLTNMELSGIMPGIFRESSWLPKVASGDFIGSEFSDLVVTNGKIHLLETALTQDPKRFEPVQWTNPLEQAQLDSLLAIDATKVYTEQVSMKAVVSVNDAVETQFSDWTFLYRGNYFQTINDESKGRKWTNANVVNFDNDDDFDLVLGFASYDTGHFSLDKQTYGMTYWENTGSREDPVWVEKKKAVTNNDPDSNLRVQNFTQPVMVWNDYYFGEGKTYDSFLGYHPLYKTSQPTYTYMLQTAQQDAIFFGTVRRFDAVYNHPTSLLAATYPEAKRIDINLQYNTNFFLGSINYGFHIFETWDNEEELRDWTLSMSTADLDGDGKNEVIVGDFNNNVYVFEHLTNNSYKRAYKSFNLNRTIETDISPYAHNQFEGISGTFTRTLFDHATHLIAGFDLNRNGKQEFIVATQSMIYVFEATYTTTLKIRDDTYELIAMIDLLDFPQLSQMNLDDIQVTALTWADDLTGNDNPELLIGINSAFLLLDIAQDKITFHDVKDYFNSPHFRYDELFFATSYIHRGSYDVPGNYIMRPSTIINSILVEDFDSDGRMDVALAGVNTESARELWSGFVSILEWDGTVFTQLADDKDFERTIEYNIVNDLAVTDADADDQKEIIIAHDQGIDIYEFDDETQIFALQEVITSNPSYQLPDRYYQGVTGGEINHQKDVIRLSDGSLFMVYVFKLSATYSSLYFQTSTDNGETWVFHSQYNHKSGAGYKGLEQPSLAQGSDGSLWVSFVERVLGTYDILGFNFAADNMIIHVSRYTAGWPQVVVDTQTNPSVWPDKVSTVSPRLYQIPDGQVDWMGLVYNHPIENELHFITIDDTGAKQSVDSVHPGVQSYQSTNYTIHSLDIVRLESSKSYSTRYEYGIVFSGYRNSEKYSLDTDIFYMPMRLNDSVLGLYNFSVPTRTFASGISAFYPSIIEEYDTENLLVTYEQTTLRPYGGLFSIWSNDQGNFWQGPFDMSHPLGFDIPLLFVAYPSSSKETYRVGTSIGNMFLSRFEPRRPVVAPGKSSGFTMTYSVDFSLGRRSSLGLCSGSQTYMAAARDTIDPKQCVQELQTFVTAYNPWSNFTWFDIGRTQKIAVGDSDRDNRQEILAASGKFATLLEYSSNTATMIHYSQKWISDEYARDVTEVAISDSNGNGFPELIVESDRGIVNAFEVTNTMMGQSGNLLRPFLEGSIASDNPAATINFIQDIVTLDITGDGKEDIIYATATGQIFAYNGIQPHNLIYQFRAYDGILNLIKKENQVIYNGLDPVYILNIHQNNITLIDIYTGEIHATMLTIASYDASKQPTISAVGDIDGIAGQEIVIGFQDGTVMALDLNLNTLWQISHASAGFLEISDVQIGNFTSYAKLQVAVATKTGTLSLLAGDTGAELWRTDAFFSMGNHFGTFETMFRVGMAIADFNNDGYSDIILGSNITIAFSGIDGSQLWNATLLDNPWSNGYYSYRPVVQDVDGDGTPDVVYSTIYDGNDENPTTLALSGLDGDFIWSYDPSEAFTNDRYLALDLVSHDFSLSRDYSGIFGINSLYDFGSTTENHIGYVLDAQGGTVLAGISVGQPLMSVAVSDLGYGYPIVLYGDWFGGLHMYSLWEGTPDPTFTPVPEGVEEPFFSIGEDFTIRTDYFLVDVMDGSTGFEPGKDGIDDVVIVDDDYVAVGDTRKLETDRAFNSPAWSRFETGFGRYLGGAKIGDVNGDGIPDIVIPFEKLMIVIELAKGQTIGKFTYPDGVAGNQDFTFELVDWDANPGNGLEIVYGRNVYDTVLLASYVEYGVLDGEGQNLYVSRSIAVSNPTFGIGNFDSDAELEMVTFTTAIFNPLIANFTIFDNKFDVLGGVSTVFFGMPPVSHIAVGNFDSVLDNDEYILFFEFSMINIPGFNFLLEKFPSIMLQLGTDAAGNLAFPSSHIFGIAPLQGFARDVYTTTSEGEILDIDKDGNTDLLVKSRSGDFYSMLFDQSSVLMQSSGIFETIAVPYGHENILIGQFCNTDSPLSFVLISSGNTITCYDSLDFRNEPNPVWSVSEDLGVIHKIVIGDLDDGDAKNDLIIGTINGYVWIVNDKSFQALDTGLKVDNVDIGLETDGMNTGYIIALAGLISSPFILIAKKVKILKK